ncbi:hypothetical protein A5662_05690 [Mycobacteriaceae bacterium 1482268.1]|nr:hypothetical protein A5662_05690 [Mycobacteriaceae bacterium 1482268.1]
MAMITAKKKRADDTDDLDEAPETHGDADAKDDDLDADTDSAEDTDDIAVSRRWTKHLRTAAIMVIVVAAMAGVGFLGWTVWQQHQVTRAGEQAQQAAVAYAQVLTSIDAGNVDQNFNEVLNGATGEFKDMYSQATVELRQLLVDNKATAHGVVVESAVQSATPSKVVLLLFVDQSITNTNVPDPRIDRSRIKMTMEKVDGRWRASKVELP